MTLAGLPRAAGLAACVLTVGACASLNAEPVATVPSPEATVVADIRGVALSPGAGGRIVRFSSVSHVRWTSSALLITGEVDSPGIPEHEQVTTMSFPLEDVSHVLVREYDLLRSAVASFLWGFAAFWVVFLVAVAT